MRSHFWAKRKVKKIHTKYQLKLLIYTCKKKLRLQQWVKQTKINCLRLQHKSRHSSYILFQDYFNNRCLQFQFVYYCIWACVCLCFVFFLFCQIVILIIICILSVHFNVVHQISWKMSVQLDSKPPLCYTKKNWDRTPGISWGIWVWVRLKFLFTIMCGARVEWTFSEKFTMQCSNEHLYA